MPSDRAAGVKVSVIGSSGFLGQALITHLSEEEYQFESYDRQQTRGLIAKKPPSSLGHIIYLVGVWEGCEKFTESTFYANVILADEICKSLNYESFTYVSTTHLYRNSEFGSAEGAITWLPSDQDRLYTISKYAGEVAVLNYPATRVVRLASVYGPGMSSNSFLMSLVRDLLSCGHVEIVSSPDSGKDYIALDDAIVALTKFAFSDLGGVHNIASGVTVTNRELASWLRALGWSVDFSGNCVSNGYPKIDISSLRSLTKSRPRRLNDSLPEIFSYLQ